ncbi:hypothetical protein GBA52_009128 [Prunus armeniaca]|nr:hypothetical protein GBA52_009128 [Prunus armeniaca]
MGPWDDGWDWTPVIARWHSSQNPNTTTCAVLRLTPTSNGQISSSLPIASSYCVLTTSQRRFYLHTYCFSFLINIRLSFLLPTMGIGNAFYLKLNINY